MKYIDAEKLIAEIERRIQRCEDCEREGEPDTTSSEATLKSLRSFINSLQQEQPVQNGKFVFPKYLYARTKDNKTIDMSYAPQDMTAMEYIRNDFVEQEQPKFKVGDTIHKIGENTVFPMTIERISDGDYVCDGGKCFVSIKFQDEYELVEQELSKVNIWHDVKKEAPTNFGAEIIVLSKNKNKEDGIWLADLIQCFEGQYEPRVNWEDPVKWAYLSEILPQRD